MTGLLDYFDINFAKSISIHESPRSIPDQHRLAVALQVVSCSYIASYVGTPPMSDATKMIVDTLYQDRLETLLSVDDLVGEVVTTLQTAGVLDNTYIFYNSDHGMYNFTCSVQTFHIEFDC